MHPTRLRFLPAVQAPAKLLILHPAGAQELQQYRREHPMYWQTNTPAGDGSLGEW